METSTEEPSRHAYWVGPVLLLLLGLVAGVWSHFTLSTAEVAAIHQLTRAETSAATSQLSAHIQSRVQTLERLVARHARARQVYRPTFEADALGCVRDFPDVCEISWTDATGAMRIVFPEEGNTHLRDIRPWDDPAQKQTWQEAVQRATLRTSRVFDLRQGGRGIVAISPLIGSEGNRGTVSAALRVAALCQIGLANFSAGFALRVKSGGSSEFENLAVSKQVWKQWSQTSKVSLPGPSWELSVTPTPEMIDKSLTLMPLLAGLSCVTTSIFLAGLAYFWQTARKQSLRLREVNHFLEREIVARVAMSEELRAARERAENANRAKGQFLANISHEIRTPMNGIIGMSQLALELDTGPEVAHHLTLIMQSADSLLSLVNDVLDFSKIEAGKLELRPVEFSLRASLAKTLEPLRFLAERKGVSLEWAVAANVTDYLDADAGRVQQVVINLVGNAIKFTDRGRVEIGVELRSERYDQLELQVSVADSGVGIPADKLQMIFTPFEQLDGSTTRKYGGTGLGLAIVAKLVELMGGKVWVQSEVGKGSRFHFTFSCRRAKSVVAPVLANVLSEMPALTRPLRVLVAEDYKVNQLIVQRILEKRGHRVTLVEDGQAAIDAVARETFDIVLMDIQMPVLGGIEATQVIRRREAGSLRRVPIIALTANVSDCDRELCLVAGASDYITKPFQPRSLLATIEQAVADREAEILELAASHADHNTAQSCEPMACA